MLPYSKSDQTVYSLVETGQDMYMVVPDTCCRYLLYSHHVTPSSIFQEILDILMHKDFIFYMALKCK